MILDTASVLSAPSAPYENTTQKRTASWTAYTLQVTRSWMSRYGQIKLTAEAFLCFNNGRLSFANTGYILEVRKEVIPVLRSIVLPNIEGPGRHGLDLITDEQPRSRVLSLTFDPDGRPKALFDFKPTIYRGRHSAGELVTVTGH